ncbi:hypothetical protein IAT40_007209 [Kwoniella sp. CBS 6097]
MKSGSSQMSPNYDAQNHIQNQDHDRSRGSGIGLGSSSSGSRSGTGRLKSTAATAAASLDTLPDDVLGQIFGQLKIDELVRLRTVGRGLSDRVITLGIPTYLSNHRQNHITLHPAPSLWDPLSLVRRNHIINRSIARHHFHALQVGATWSQAVIPTLNIMADHVYVGVGGKVLAYPLIPPAPSQSNSHSLLQNGYSIGYGHQSSGSGVEELYDDGRVRARAQRGSKVVDRAREFPIGGKRDSGGRADVIGVIPLPTTQEGQAQSMIVGQFDGTIQRLNLSDEGPSIPRITAKYLPSSTASFGVTTGLSTGYRENIHTLTGNEDGSKFMSSSVSGLVNIHTTRSPWTPPVSMQISTTSSHNHNNGKINPRAWSSCLVTSNPALQPTAFLGVQGSIDVHTLTSTGFKSSSSEPTRRLIGPEEPLFSSPYDITLPPTSTYTNTNSASHPNVLSTNHHPAMVLSAWYDSHLRIHDLRSSSKLAVNSYMDPYTWADGSAFYSTCFLGGHYIAGGGARHGTVSIFDVRQNNRPITKMMAADDQTNENRIEDGREGTINKPPTSTRPGWSCFSPGGKGSPVYKLQGEGGRIWGVTECRSFVLSFDDAGFIPNGIISSNCSNTGGHVVRDKDNNRGREAPSGWKGRGGKWGWTVRYDQDQYTRATGYEHVERGIELFDSLELA